jgi:serine/threonine protein phosphatase PrpC
MDANIPVLTLTFAHVTKGGYVPSNPDKTNQDAFIECPNFALRADWHFFAVCDGHGYFGGDVSAYVKQRLPEVLRQERSIASEPSRALKRATLICDHELGASDIDVRFSGTTFVGVLIQGNKLYCANAGDSRAVLARQEGYRVDSRTRQWVAVALSRDHKPNDPDENKRIVERGGRVMPYYDEDGEPMGPHRVWLKDHDLPGLAMSRSLGDAVAASVGVSPEPELLELTLSAADKFIVIASDGVYEFLSSEEVVKIVAPYWKARDAQGACMRLLEEAEARWHKEEEVVDDITAVVVFLAVL